MLGTAGLQENVLARGGGDFKGEKKLKSSLNELTELDRFRKVESAVVV